MSFGFSVSDIIALGELALKLYHSCKESSRTLRIIGGELESLHAVLEESRQTLLVLPPPPDSEARLRVVLNGCSEVLNDLQKLIDEYERPGAKRSKIWNGVKLYNEKISEIRARLTSNVAMLTAFIRYVTNSRVIIGWRVDNYIAMHPPEGRPRSIDSQCSADRIAWRKIRKELEANGISLEAFEVHKRFIMRRLVHAIQMGALEERFASDSESELPIESESTPSNDINSTTSNTPSTNSSTELRPATEHHNSGSLNRQLLQFANGTDREIAPECSLQVASVRSSIYVELPTIPLPDSLEPAVSCGWCGKFNIAFELHMRCQQCGNGNFDICLRCWRLGRGCPGWYGFGQRALDRYKNGECPFPHYLTGRRYRRVMVPKAPTDQDHKLILTETSDSHGNIQLQSGEFCSICSKFGQGHLMVCGECNCGEWAYCVACVNQGRCCTHSLRPVFLSTDASYRNSIWYERTEKVIDLTFDTRCHSCAIPIGFSENGYHCPECNNGYYDLCKGCYLGLVTSGQISEANGPQGWRRCLEGHRMIVITFEYSASIQKRIIVEDLVGGHAPHASSQYPPRGDLEPSMVALCSSWPGEEDHDVLAFPEGAEIQEVQDHDGGWFSGVYCGREGSFLATWALETADHATDSPAPKLPPRHQGTELESFDP